MKRLVFLAVVACLCGCVLTGTGRAGVVYTTFGEPGDTFDTSVQSVSGGLGPFSYRAFAAAFTPSASVTLDSFRFAFGTGDTARVVTMALRLTPKSTSW